MYRFKDKGVQKEFYLERFAERLEFRKVFSYFLLGTVTLYVLNDLLYAIEDTISWYYFGGRTIAVGIIAVLWLKIVKLNFFKTITEGNKIYFVDFFIFLPLLLVQTAMTIISSNDGYNIAKEDGVEGYFYALDMGLNFIWTLSLSEFGMTNWIFKILYFLGFWTPIFVLRSRRLPSLAGLYLGVRTLIYLAVIIFFQERSSRLNFVTKRDRQKKIEMFETILKRIHEQIVVFNRKMEIKYSNIGAERLSPETDSPTEEIIQNITSLRLLSGSILHTNFAKIFESDSKDELNLSQCLDQIAKTDEFYNELGERDFIQIEGRSYGNNLLSKIPLYPETRYYTLQLFTNCLHDEECIVVIIKEITEHISMLQEKNNLQSNLLSSLSHELKTPLGISIGLLDRAVEDYKTPLETSKKYLIPALNYGKLLTFFINDIMDFLKIQKYEFQLNPDYFCIENVLEEVTRLFSMSFKKKNLSIRLDYNDAVRTVIRSDPQRLKQVLVNLLANAVKYTMQGSITVGFVAADDFSYIFYIKDTGIGIRTEELEVLNKKLESINFCVTVNANSTGAGIGLIVANAIAKSMNPETNLGLNIESEFGVGSKFSFLVENISHKARKPSSTNFGCEIRDENSPKEKIGQVAVSSYKSSVDLFSVRSRTLKGKNKQFSIHTEDYELPLQSQDRCCCKRILVADDEVFNTIAVEMICKPFGFAVDCAFNGQQALEFIERRSTESCSDDCKPYSLIIMDCNMPIMDGYQATRHIRDSIKAGVWKEIPIVGCTAYEGKEKLEECLRSGMDMYVKKPLDRSKFTQLLSKFNIY